MATSEEIRKWVSALADQDGLVREKNRKKLEGIGKSATPYLLTALKDPKTHRRWEATKALRSIADPAAAADLVDRLMDESDEIRWLAAEALIALQGAAVVPLLNALVQHFNSVWLRQGAHHVLHTLERNHMLDESLQQVLDALRSIEPEMTAPWAAERALENLMRNSS